MFFFYCALTNFLLHVLATREVMFYMYAQVVIYLATCLQRGKTQYFNTILTTLKAYQQGKVTQTPPINVFLSLYINVHVFLAGQELFCVWLRIPNMSINKFL